MYIRCLGMFVQDQIFHYMNDQKQRLNIPPKNRWNHLLSSIDTVGETLNLSKI